VNEARVRMKNFPARKASYAPRERERGQPRVGILARERENRYDEGGEYLRNEEG